MPEQFPLEKLQMLWNINNEFGLDRNMFDIILEVLCTCCHSVEECSQMEMLFSEQVQYIYNYYLSVTTSLYLMYAVPADVLSYGISC